MKALLFSVLRHPHGGYIMSDSRKFLGDRFPIISRLIMRIFCGLG